MEEGVKEKLRQQIRSYLLRLASQSDAEHPAWNQELIRKGSGNRWNYIDGCMISGMLRFSELIREEGLFDFSERFVSHFISEGGEIPSYRREEYRLDDLNPGRNLFLLFERTGKEKYREALRLLRGQLETQPRTEEGSFWHKKIYQEQVWLDGIYMALPFYLEYELRFHPGDFSGLYDIVSQLRIVKKRMREEESGLYVHGYDASRKAFWADPESGR
ncbi:MAG: glycoside hydrolase family 88 protein, partial [Oribacterium sp.]